MKIGILIAGHVPDEMQPQYGDYDVVFPNFLAGHGLSFEPFFVVDGQFPDGPDAADGWLITGSKHGVYEDHAWIPPLENLIRQIHARRHPLVGICFGHQIIAQALGGRVEKFNEGWAMGRTHYSGEDGRLTLNAWHQDQVVEAPAEARVLAGNDFCANAVLAYGDHVWSVQPHPEFSAQYVHALGDARRDVVPADRLRAALADVDGANDNDTIAAFIADFFLKPRDAA